MVLLHYQTAARVGCSTIPDPALERSRAIRSALRPLARLFEPRGQLGRDAQITMRSVSSTVTVSAVRSQSFVVLGDACPAVCCACSRVLPFDGYAVIPVARKVWQQVDGGSAAPAALDHRHHGTPLERAARQSPTGRVHALEERRLRLFELAAQRDREQRSVAEPGQGARVDRFEELLRLRRREDRRRALGDDVFRAAHDRGGVHREDLIDDEPVAEHADRGQVLLHGRDRAGGAGCSGQVERRDDAQPETRASHHPKNCPTVRPYAARVLAFAIRPREETPGTAPPLGARRRRSLAAGQSALPARGGRRRRGGRRQSLPWSFRHHFSPTESTTDERLEPPQVVPERLGQRVEPRQGVIRPVEPHLDPGRPTDTPSGRSASYALVVSVDTLNRIPVNRTRWSWAIRRASVLLGAERGPPLGAS